jgi:hypothetical protein
VAVVALDAEEVAVGAQEVIWEALVRLGQLPEAAEGSLGASAKLAVPVQ